MILWLILVLMTAAAIIAVLWPLFREGKSARTGSDVVVYRDQLEEVERDVAAGLFGKTEAEAARVEISRRLLAAADDAQAAPTAINPQASLWRRRAVAVVSLLLLPVVSGALYLRLGSPGLASGPAVAERTIAPHPEMSVEALVAKAEEHLQRNPEDGRGWAVLAPVYMQLGRYSDSVLAWRNTLRLLGETADRQANFGEALMAEANGIITAEAKTAFTRAVTIDNTTVSARFYLGVAAQQDGERDKAAKIWRDLIAEAPAGAPWVSDVQAALAKLDGKPAPLPGPTPAEMLAASKQPPAQQDAMIRGMVESLAAKLKQDGSNPDDWVRLVRSYKVLGETDKAQAAIGDARKALAGDAEKLARLGVALNELDKAPAPVASANPPAEPNAAPPLHDEETIRDMVGRLAARLQQSEADPEGWIMLTRSYRALGEKDKADAAMQQGRQALAGDPVKLQAFEDGLRGFKLDDGAKPVR
jgi:cytochrome c-type biogenesis protein CcmH